MAVSLCLLLALCQPPQSADASLRGSTAVLVAGVTEQGRLPLRALGLGDGGLGEAVRGRGGPGELTTPGGVLVRAQIEGVKLDFPSGRELLVAPNAAIWLRGGEHTDPCLNGLELWLADGARVRIERESSPREPLRSVEVITEHGTVELWRAQRRMVRANSMSRPALEAFLVLGEGDVLYRALPLGPLLVLERVLCPVVERGEYPAQRAIVCADPLAESLRALPEHVPAHRVQFPQAIEAAANLAELAPRLFPRGMRARPPGPSGAMVFGLPYDFRLTIAAPPQGPARIGLTRGDADVPIVEWLVGPRTTLQLVRPGGGIHGGARYFLDGLDLTAQARALLEVRTTAQGSDRARDVLRALGAHELIR
jgi:hypothetical protein